MIPSERSTGSRLVWAGLEFHPSEWPLNMMRWATASAHTQRRAPRGAIHRRKCTGQRPAGAMMFLFLFWFRSSYAKTFYLVPVTREPRSRMTEDDGFMRGLGERDAPHAGSRSCRFERLLHSHLPSGRPAKEKARTGDPGLALNHLTKARFLIPGRHRDVHRGDAGGADCCFVAAGLRLRLQPPAPPGPARLQRD
jgi:hypothetical protein